MKGSGNTAKGFLLNLDGYGHRGILNGRAKAVLEAHIAKKERKERKQHDLEKEIDVGDTKRELTSIDEQNEHEHGENGVDRWVWRNRNDILSSARYQHPDDIGVNDMSTTLYDLSSDRKTEHEFKGQTELLLPDISGNPIINIDDSQLKDANDLEESSVPLSQRSLMSPRLGVLDSIFEEHMSARFLQSRKRRRSRLLEIQDIEHLTEENIVTPDQTEETTQASEVEDGENKDRSKVKGGGERKNSIPNTRPESKNEGTSRSPGAGRRLSIGWIVLQDAVATGRFKTQLSHNKGSRPSSRLSQTQEEKTVNNAQRKNKGKSGSMAWMRMQEVVSQIVNKVNKRDGESRSSSRMSRTKLSTPQLQSDTARASPSFSEGTRSRTNSVNKRPVKTVKERDRSPQSRSVSRAEMSPNRRCALFDLYGESDEESEEEPEPEPVKPPWSDTWYKPGVPVRYNKKCV